MEAGLSNRPAQDLSRSEWQIIKGNLFTFFNLLFVVLALCLVAVGAYRDIAFLGIVALNTLIGIVQEIRVKHTLDRIALLSARPATAVRDGAPVQLPADQLVLDDIVLLETGSQVCADAVVCEGKVEVNEALLTGEADAVLKKPGDTLLSGSFIVSGRCAARLEQVGDGCYAASISREAKRNKKNRSQIMRSLDSWLKVVGIAIVPLGLLMVWRQSGLDTGLTYAVSSTVAALVGMIPEGLYLLVSVALAVSVLGLARRHTLVHEMSCIENLARVDVLCLDKTGTLTAGSMRVEEVLPVGGTGQAALETALGGFAHAAESGNATATALKVRFAPQGWQP